MFANGFAYAIIFTAAIIAVFTGEYLSPALAPVAGLATALGMVAMYKEDLNEE